MSSLLVLIFDILFKDGNSAEKINNAHVLIALIFIVSWGLSDKHGVLRFQQLCTPTEYDATQHVSVLIRKCFSPKAKNFIKSSNHLISKHFHNVNTSPTAVVKQLNNLFMPKDKTCLFIAVFGIWISC